MNFAFDSFYLRLVIVLISVLIVHSTVLQIVTPEKKPISFDYSPQVSPDNPDSFLLHREFDSKRQTVLESSMSRTSSQVERFSGLSGLQSILTYDISIINETRAGFVTTNPKQEFKTDILKCPDSLGKETTYESGDVVREYHGVRLPESQDIIKSLKSDLFACTFDLQTIPAPPTITVEGGQVKIDFEEKYLFAAEPDFLSKALILITSWLIVVFGLIPTIRKTLKFPLQGKNYFIE